MTTSGIPVLRGPRVVLRGVESRDIDERRRLGIHPEIQRGYGGSQLAESRELSLEEGESWYAQCLAKGSETSWVIEVGGSLAGVAFLHQFSEADRRARFAIGLMAPKYLGIGLGTEVTRLVLAHAFYTLRLHRVDLRVLASNERAITAYLKCGFVVEGRERESCLMDGRWHDDLIMGVLDHEYRALVASWPTANTSSGR